MGTFRGGRGVFALAALLVPTLVSCRQILGIHPSCSDPLMIDDMEDGDGAICNTGMRAGAWLTLGDATGTLEPAPSKEFLPTKIPGGRGPASHYAARFKGSGWASMAFTLNESQPLLIDPSQVGGITFFMKSNVAVSVEFLIPATFPAGFGGGCMAGATDCLNNFRFQISAPLKPDDWIQYNVPFTALAQSPGNRPRNPTFGTAGWTPNLIGVEFHVDGDADFDVWVDDVAFYRCLADYCLPTCPASAPHPCPATGLSPAACWPADTACPTIPFCNNQAAPIGCPPKGAFLGGCGPPGTDCSTVHYFGLWGAGPADIWAVGSRGTILHSTGGAWSAQPSGTPEDLFGVWGSGPKDVWAVGMGGAAVHFSGAIWSPVDSSTKNHLESVWGTGLGDVWAVGLGGTIIHWNATGSPQSESATTQNLFAVWGSGFKDVWAVGDAGTIVHWDGAAWSPTKDSGTGQLLLGVWGTALDNVWAFGHLGTIVHWNGQVWSALTSPTTQPLHAMWGTSAANDFWIVGDNVILRGDGVNWAPVQDGAEDSFQSIWGSGPADIWAVGFADTVLHWDAATWMDRHP